MTSCASPLSQPMADTPQASPRERRLIAEWDLLQSLAHLNPERIGDLAVEDEVFSCTLHKTPALRVGTKDIVTSHRLKIVFPLYYPSVPLELYLKTPVAHPNVHPRTGFLCLWDKHQVSNNVEHALHKTVAMLSRRLENRNPVHVMQPDLQMLSDADYPARGEPLLGIAHPETAPSGTAHAGLLPDELPARRRRLS